MSTSRTAEPATSPLVAGPLAKSTLALAWPSIASLLLQATFSIVDTLWVGRLGAEALAALNASAFVVWSVESIAVICSVGPNAVISRHVGAGNPAQAREASGHAFKLAVLAAMATTVAGVGLIGPTFGFMRTAPEVTAIGESYLVVIFLGSFTVFLASAIEATFRANGDTRTPMKLLGGSLVANILLDPLFIFGVGPLPALGARGAALATVLCRCTAVVIGLWLLRRRSLTSARTAVSFSLTEPLRLARLGLPIVVSQVSFCLVYVALARVIARFGTPAVAAVGIGHKAESVAYFVSAGFAFAAATIVGQNLGAQQPARAIRASAIACGFATLAATVIGLTMFFAPHAIARAFIADPDVVEIAVHYMRIVAISEIFLVYEIVLEGAFGGAGDTVPPLVVSGPLSIARVPLAYVLAVTLDWGADGIWWAISITTVLKGTLMAAWFWRRSARWA